MAEKTGSAGLLWFSRGLSVALPNFQALSYPKNVIATNVVLPDFIIAVSAAHAMLYLALVLLFATIVFSFKNFENA
jgi:hypothetical protein